MQALTSLIRRLSKRKFVRNVAGLSFATALGQAVTLAAAPVITRLYGPEAFGQLGTFAALLAVAAPLATLSYHLAIVLPEQDARARQLSRLAIRISAVFCSCLLALIAIHKLLSHQLEGHAMLWLLPVAVLSTSLLYVHSQWTARVGAFAVLAKLSMVQVVWTNGLKIILGLISPTAIALVAVTAFAPAVYAGMLGRLVPSRGIVRERVGAPEGGLTSYREAGREYRDFAIYRTPQVVLKAFALGLPVMLLGALFDMKQAGFYALARMALGAPTTLIGQSMSTVIYPRIAQARNRDENVARLVIQGSLALSGLAAVPFLTIIVFGPQLFGLIFGAEWVDAGEFSRWMGMWMLIMLIAGPSVAAIPALGIQRFYLLYEIASTAILLIVFASAWKLSGEPIWTVASYCVANGVLYLFLIQHVIRVSSRSASVRTEGV
ncbi:lipopolysaccharide biosynthesis protein [Luteimonas sp. A277]